ncbi:flagellar biosynthesis protein FlhB [Legionella sp. km772]|uniref:flagellar biosynthesis protein FlhB n=1 Tax=Legionella sp. km772 TaxID=2498111 RepID=UPI000F8ED168|nr:flagellar biosynthesis protein FlhB [Legionella sp. km772]RUR08336.1 flagellar biosynthesis protein FlhB [Legionella sp. km772]
MAEEDQAQEKTEEPSAKRLREAKEKGQVARSKDFNATLILLFTAMGFSMFGQKITNHLVTMMREAFEFNADLLTTTASTMERLYYLSQYGVKSILPLLIVIFVLSLAAPLLIGGWVFSKESLSPKFSRLNPLKGFARMVSVKGLMEMLKALLKVILVAAVSILVMKIEIPLLLALGNSPLEVAISEGTNIIVKSFAWISASLIVIALIDVPFQLYEHHKALKMTKQELKDEYKDTEGKPEVKGAIRRAQHEVARRRMMAEVPKADVVLTNPTHYAVAISYKNKKSKAPIVVAKGRDLIAFQINNEAQKNNVPIISVPPLARAIYFSTKLNKEIPRGLYIAVAQVLAYVFQLSDKQRYDHKPAILQDVPIPPELAKEAEEELDE